MNNYTMDTYEVKRKIVNFAQKISKELSKANSKFVCDMQYGIAKSGSVLISEISRSLDEKIKLNNTIERLCNNLANFEDGRKIMQNYYNEIKDMFPEDSIALFDDTDVAKVYGNKFEDLDSILDASDKDKRMVNGYHVCEAVILSKKEKQPIPVYSKIYSCKSNDFRSKHNYTFESIDAVSEVLERSYTGVFDRLYDDNKYYEKMDCEGNKFVIRVQDKRTLLFKGKKRNCAEVVKKRKGKVKMDLWFQEENKEIYISHTKVTLPNNNQEYYLVSAYGLSDEQSLMLLTNREIKDKTDVIKIVRLYMYRWRIEEYFRAKKQEFKFEGFRVRTLKAMNNLNTMLTIHLGQLSILAESINSKLLSIKIVMRSKSLRNKIVVWLSQVSRGIREILKFAKMGIKEYQKVETRPKELQLELLL